MVNDTVGLKLKYPSLQSVNIIGSNQNSIESIINLIADHVVYVFDQENVYEEFTRQEVVDFLETLNSTQFKKVTEFFTNIPELRHDINWTCPSCGKDESVTLQGLQSFFI